MKHQERLFTTAGLAGEVQRRTGISVPEQTIRNLENRGIITVQRNSANQRIYTLRHFGAVSRYIQDRERLRAKSQIR